MLSFAFPGYLLTAGLESWDKKGKYEGDISSFQHGKKALLNHSRYK